MTLGREIPDPKLCVRRGATEGCGVRKSLNCTSEAESIPVWIKLGMGAARGTGRGLGSSVSNVIISKIRENEPGYLDDINSGLCRRPQLTDQVVSVLSANPPRGLLAGLHSLR